MCDVQAAIEVDRRGPLQGPVRGLSGQAGGNFRILAKMVGPSAQYAGGGAFEGEKRVNGVSAGEGQIKRALRRGNRRFRLQIRRQKLKNRPPKPRNRPRIRRIRRGKPGNQPLILENQSSILQDSGGKS
jgi:hypothetical protein